MPIGSDFILSNAYQEVDKACANAEEIINANIVNKLKQTHGVIITKDIKMPLLSSRPLEYAKALSQLLKKCSDDASSRFNYANNALLAKEEGRIITTSLLCFCLFNQSYSREEFNKINQKANALYNAYSELENAIENYQNKLKTPAVCIQNK